MNIEDGFLLSQDPEALFKKMDRAEFRLREHYENEAKRIRGHAKTDMQRYLDGERVRD